MRNQTGVSLKTKIAPVSRNIIADAEQMRSCGQIRNACSRVRYRDFMRSLKLVRGGVFS